MLEGILEIKLLVILNDNVNEHCFISSTESLTMNFHWRNHGIKGNLQTGLNKAPLPTRQDRYRQGKIGTDKAR